MKAASEREIEVGRRDKGERLGGTVEGVEGM